MIDKNNLCMHLNPKLYRYVQSFVHQNYQKTVKTLFDFLDVREGDSIVELGCGDGLFAKFFTERNCKYFGIDIDKERIKVAQKQYPKATFFVSNLEKFDFSLISPSTKFFCHGVLHHLNDKQCKKIIKDIFSYNEKSRFVAIEPIRPKSLQNPLATIVIKLDDGKYIRKLDEWRDIYRESLTKSQIFNLFPRWPTNKLAVLLTSHKI